MNTNTTKNQCHKRYTYSHLFFIPALTHMRIPFIGDYLRIVCSICNKYRTPVDSSVHDMDVEIACKMKALAKQSNELQEFVQENGV